MCRTISPLHLELKVPNDDEDGSFGHWPYSYGLHHDDQSSIILNIMRYLLLLIFWLLVVSTARLDLASFAVSLMKVDVAALLLSFVLCADAFVPNRHRTSRVRLKSVELEALEVFERWCEWSGATFPKLVVKPSPEYGLGVYATADISQGETVLTVPLSMCLIDWEGLDPDLLPIRPTKATFSRCGLGIGGLGSEFFRSGTHWRVPSFGGRTLEELPPIPCASVQPASKHYNAYLSRYYLPATSARIQAS